MTDDNEIPIRNFEEDLKLSNSKELRVEWERVFRKAFDEDLKIIWKDDKISQQDFGSDVLIKTKKGRKFSVDHKTRRNDYYEWDCYLLEIAHHIYSDEERKNKLKTKEGWLYCSTSDFIFYGTLNKENNKIIEVCGFSLIPFKQEEFKSEIGLLKNKWASTKYENGNFQLTLNKQVNIEFLKNNADKFWYWKDENKT